MTQIKRTMGVLEWTLLIILSVLWGSSFFLGEMALRELPPFTLVFGRVALAALVLNLAVLASGQRFPSTIKLWLPFFAMGFLNNLVPFSLIFWGQTHISSGLASILNATTPIFTVILAHLFTRDEKMRPRHVIGVLIGFTGATLIIGPDALRDLGVSVIAQIAVLGAAISYSFAGVFGRRFREESSLVVAAGQLTGTTVMMIPILIITEQPWTLAMPSGVTWAALAALALLSTALAYIIYFRLLATAGATNLLLVTFLIPMTALLLGFFFLGERFGLVDLAGMGIILTGLLAIDGRVFQRFVRPPRSSAALAQVSTERQQSDYDI